MKEIFLILLLQLIYVPLLTLRIIMLVKNRSVIASIIGFMECLIYVFGLSLVFNGKQNTIGMIIYAIGYSLGIALGGYIERKLALGYTTFVITLHQENEKLILDLRNQGYGVTIFEGEGRYGKRYKLDIVTERKRERELMDFILWYEPEAFIVSYELKTFKGGYLPKKRGHSHPDVVLKK
ncbi:DUF2179 domain-containing protein [Aneurinibacillus tyrosinisolvens]|uniref:DUF2179 domain-containing protein n=1 Tax=Aneurinibacillus tyrosinisolvens TaxID=1443435 RepID=UPI00063F9D60|nr:DUF2179 domain-containing protein [Aneurinibacillus tyrosinisolvens]